MSYHSKIFFFHGTSLNCDRTWQRGRFVSTFSSIEFSWNGMNINWIMLAPAGIFVLISFFNLLSRVNYLSIKQQLYRYVLIWLAIFSSLLMIMENAKFAGIYLLALAAIVPLNYYFKTIKSRFWSDIQILFILISAIILMQYEF